MNITELKYFVYKAQLPTPIQTSQLLIRDRSGILIRLKSEDGRFGYGEASPLPEFSRENIKEVIETIQRIEARLKFEKSISDNNLLKLSSNIVSLNFGFEQALFLLNTPPETESLVSYNIPVNFLVGQLPASAVLSAVEDAVNTGYKTVKLKIGNKAFSEDLSLIKQIRQSFKDVKLRLDVNGAWSLTAAEKNIGKLESMDIQFIEQPVKGLNNLLAVAAKVETPIAADESITSLPDAELLINSGIIDYLVIKPMNIGFVNTLKITELANKNGKRVIISSLFESPVGRNALFFLAAKSKHQLAHGVSINLKMENELLEHNTTIVNGTISYNGNLYPYKHSIDTLFE